MTNKPIGIFDSGLGGLSVFKELKQCLPNEDIIYISDNKYCPYGSKPENEILDRTIFLTNYLISKNCKLIVIACNTATTAAIHKLRRLYTIPFVGMEPAIKPAAELTKTGKIGILATVGTLNSNHYKTTKEKYASNIETIIQPGDGLVELVEQGTHLSNNGEELIRKHTEKMIRHGVDYIVLGCTHYPFYQPILNKIIPSNIKIINPAPAIAKRVENILSEKNLLTNSQKSKYSFYSTGNKQVFEKFLKQEFNISSNVSVINE